jgi:hypothetical protein
VEDRCGDGDVEAVGLEAAQLGLAKSTVSYHLARLDGRVARA